MGNFLQSWFVYTNSLNQFERYFLLIHRVCGIYFDNGDLNIVDDFVLILNKYLIKISSTIMYI